MFWERFYGLCTSTGIKPNPLAEIIGVSSGLISKWKNQGTLPSGETLIAIAHYFGCSVDYLLGLSASQTPHDASSDDVLSEDEQRLIKRYRQLDDDGKDVVRSAAIAEQRRVASEKGMAVSKIG